MTTRSLFPSPDGASFLAALAALDESSEPLTAYAVHQGACELLEPLLRPTQTSINRFLDQAADVGGGHPAAGLVRTSETSSSRAKRGAYQITRQGRKALHLSLAAPVSLTTAVYGLNAFDAKVLLAYRYADGKFAGAFLAAQRRWLDENPVGPVVGAGAVIEAISSRRARELELVIGFIDDLQRLQQEGK